MSYRQRCIVQGSNVFCRRALVSETKRGWSVLTDEERALHQRRGVLPYRYQEAIQDVHSVVHTLRRIGDWR